MKKILLSLSLLITVTAFAQSAKYVKGMQKAIADMDSAKSTEQLQSTAATFERIGDAEKNQWLPYYYAALCQTNIGWMDKKVNKDQLAEKTNGLLVKAEAIDKNSEIYIIRSMVATQQFLVDPQNRYQTYLPESIKAYETAKKLDPSNPRAYYLEGTNVMQTPAAFGGGKDKAKPILQKSVELFKTFKPASALHPKWGQQLAEGTLATASK
ncbi:MAG TPA: hypothetical protein VF622_11450 [Segetibacter sp.]|jgi:hypothetical protein